MVPFLVGAIMGLGQGVVVSLLLILITSPFGSGLGFHVPSLEAVLLLSFTIPIIEESLFRSWILIALRKSTVLRVKGMIRSEALFLLLVVLVQGVIFGALHLMRSLDAITFFATASGGIIYGLLVWRFRSLVPGFSAHAFYNLALLILL